MHPVGVDGSVHSLVLASDYRVRDPRRMWELLVGWKSELIALGAHHVVVYASDDEPGRVLMTVGMRHREPVARLMRSPSIRNWFAAAGVEDLPMVFAGEMIEKIDVVDTTQSQGLVTASFARVHDVQQVASEVRSAMTSSSVPGIRKARIFRALDDDREMLTLQEIDDEGTQHRWFGSPERSNGGHYPPVFVGRLVNVLTLDSPG